ncbi:hypothetical protein BH09PAT2_BH09PAT2_07140 [soil metagenome]
MKNWKDFLGSALTLLFVTIAVIGLTAEKAPPVQAAGTIILVPTPTPIPVFGLPNYGQIYVSNSIEQITQAFPGANHVRFDTIKANTRERTGVFKLIEVAKVAQNGKKRGEFNEIPPTWEDSVEISVMNGGIQLAHGYLLKFHAKENRDIVTVDFNLLWLK